MECRVNSEDIVSDLMNIVNLPPLKIILGYKGDKILTTEDLKLHEYDDIYRKKKTSTKSKSIFSEDFDVIIDGNVGTHENENESKDDQRFNTEKHHKQQHKF